MLATIDCGEIHAPALIPICRNYTVHLSLSGEARTGFLIGMTVAGQQNDAYARAWLETALQKTGFAVVETTEGPAFYRQGRRWEVSIKGSLVHLAFKLLSGEKIVLH